MVRGSNGDHERGNVHSSSRYNQPDGSIQVSDSDVKTVLVGVAADDIMRVWPMILQRVQQACLRSNGRHTSDNILRALLERRMQLWVFWNHVEQEIKGFCITEILTFETGLKVVSGVICTGRDRAEWTAHRKTIEDWGREKGCSAIHIWARRGWERELPDYKLTHVILEKQL